VSRRLPSILANKLISVATGVALHDYGISLKVFRAEVGKPLKLYGEKHGGERPRTDTGARCACSAPGPGWPIDFNRRRLTSTDCG